ncbi:MAG: glucosaminidase domain-containing protein [Candidatus Peribacteraceae bacterium]|nr:glucosaminidase domain-containing protein [Candidatus Peribacteraceae bacterium]
MHRETEDKLWYVTFTLFIGLCIAMLVLVLFKGYPLFPEPVIEETPVVIGSYTFADPCGLESVICANEKMWDTEKVIRAIAFLETQNGKTGVGRSKNNLTGIRSSVEYWDFPTQQASIDFSIKLWDTHYADLSIDEALAKWKTGSRFDRSEATLRYISNFKGIYE